MSELSRGDIVKFLEDCVHRTITMTSDPNRFIIITNVLYEYHIKTETGKFSKETLDRIEGFRVTRNPKKKSLLVEVKYKDSPKFHSISWANLIARKRLTKNPKPTQHSKVNTAFRHHIHYQLVNYRERQPLSLLKCVICESSESTRLEVDHVPPRTFKRLRDHFLQSLEIDEDDVKVWWNGKRYCLSNVKLAEEWEQYHFSNAKYRILCDACNKATRE